MTEHEFYLTDDAGVRIGLLDHFAYASYSRSTRGYGVIQFGLPLEEWISIAPYIFQPDWRLDVWRSPGYNFSKRRESSYLLRKYRIYDQQEGVRMIEFHGRCPLDILRRWSVASTLIADYKKTGPADDLMKDVVTQEFITEGNCVPVGELTVEGDLGLGPIITDSFCGKNVLKICQGMKEATFNLHETSSANRRIFFDVVERPATSGDGFDYVFRTYADLRGSDKRENLIFSVENGNIKTPEYFEDYLDEITVAQVNSTTVTGVDSTLSRWNSILAFRSTYASDVDTDTAAANKMIGEGMKKKSLGAYFISTPGSSDQPRSLYGLDWDLGDLLRVQYAGKDMDAEVEIVWVSVNQEGIENIVGSNRVGE